MPKKAIYGEYLEEYEKNTPIGKAIKALDKGLKEIGWSGSQFKVTNKVRKYPDFVIKNQTLLAAAIIIYQEFGENLPRVEEFLKRDSVQEITAQTLALFDRYGNKRQVTKDKNAPLKTQTEIYAYLIWLHENNPDREE